jgi:hypothetical protein
MAVLIDEPAAFEIKFVDSFVYFYSARKFVMRNPTTYLRSIRLVDSVVTQVLKQTWSDSDFRSSGNYVDVRRARLSYGMTVADVFDKTGTVTSGTPEVVAVKPGGDRTEEALLTLVAAGEQYSSHALAASLVADAQQRGYVLPAVTDAREVATHGVQARVGSELVTVGKPAFVAEQALGLTRLELSSGEAAVYVAVDDQYAGATVLRDVVRAEAPGCCTTCESWASKKP